MFDHPDFDGHEQVVHAHDAASGLKAVIALHSTALGPAFGGCRMWPYASSAQALTDVLRLSRAMTYKAAICGLPYGGGKAVILGDPRKDKTLRLLEAMGRLVESLAGRFIIADDVGTTLDDLVVMRRQTRHTAAATGAAQAPLAVTAHGVLHAIEAAARHVLKAGELRGLTVAVQGLGNVGSPLCALLHERGARLIVSDIDRARVDSAVRRFGAQAAAPDTIYDQAADIFAPCALGGILDDATIGRLKARIVCGGANNQLATPGHAAAIAARGIVYIPDYLAGAGGLIDFHQESIDDSPDAVLRAVARIGTFTTELLTAANASGRTPAEVGAERVCTKLAQARRQTT